LNSTHRCKNSKFLQYFLIAYHQKYCWSLNPKLHIRVYTVKVQELEGYCEISSSGDFSIIIALEYPLTQHSQGKSGEISMSLTLISGLCFKNLIESFHGNIIKMAIRADLSVKNLYFMLFSHNKN